MVMAANYIILFAASILGPKAIGAIKVAQNLMGVASNCIVPKPWKNIVPVRSAAAFS